jgi:hypothetical protein
MSKKQDHKRWRKSFNQSCLERDKYKCVFCETSTNLDVHHIIDRHDSIISNSGYSLSNGITLCQDHHLLCEEFHIKGTCEMKYHPDNLFKLINSSKEKAISDSQKLK